MPTVSWRIRFQSVLAHLQTLWYMQYLKNTFTKYVYPSLSKYVSTLISQITQINMNIVHISITLQKIRILRWIQRQCTAWVYSVNCFLIILIVNQHERKFRSQTRLSASTGRGWTTGNIWMRHMITCKLEIQGSGFPVSVQYLPTNASQNSLTSSPVSAYRSRGSYICRGVPE